MEQVRSLTSHGALFTVECKVIRTNNPRVSNLDVSDVHLPKTGEISGRSDITFRKNALWPHFPGLEKTNIRKTFVKPYK